MFCWQSSKYLEKKVLINSETQTMKFREVKERTSSVGCSNSRHIMCDGSGSEHIHALCLCNVVMAWRGRRESSSSSFKIKILKCKYLYVLTHFFYKNDFSFGKQRVITIDLVSKITHYLLKMETGNLL